MSQDHINLILLLLSYGVIALILIGISVLMVNYSIRATKMRNEDQIEQTAQSKYQRIV